MQTLSKKSEVKQTFSLSTRYWPFRSDHAFFNSRMLTYEFGQHLIFLLEFGLHRGQPFGFGGRGPSSSCLGAK